MAEPVGDNAKAQIQSYVEQALKHHDELDALKVKHLDPVRSILGDMYKKAKAEGFDVKSLKETVRKRRLPKDTREQMDIYEHALLSDLLE